MDAATPETPMRALAAFASETEALSLIMGRLHWDQETVMPKGAQGQRAEELAALEKVLHARRCDPRIGDWLDAAKPETGADAAILREARRAYTRATRLPEDLAVALVRAASHGHHAWVEARRTETVGTFLPHLETLVRLKREEAAALSDGGADPYDALVEDYEPGMTGAEIAALFDRMRPRLVALREAVLGAERKAPSVKGRFPAEAQLRLSKRLGQVFGYDFERGRIDLSVHPFSMGSGSDVRITTRIDEAEPFGCIYSTIHELGHACYEQAVDAAYALSPLGAGASMGVHESQSRIYENQLGRSRAFAEWLFGAMTEEFGELGLDGPEALHAAANAVHPGFIRTEADEVHYNLHIMLRFDLERALISGDLAVADLEAAWNDRFAADFGMRVDRPSDGVLQDVHWSEGLFGYFPTYTLGNVYAGCLHARLRADLPDLDSALARGEATVATAWLKDNLQRHGRLLPPRDTVERAIGGPVSEGPLLDYLEEKFRALYGL